MNEVKGRKEGKRKKFQNSQMKRKEDAEISKEKKSMRKI